MFGTCRYCKSDFDTTSYYILVCSPEHFRNHFRDFAIFDSGNNTEYIQVTPRILRIILVLWHVLYSFFLSTKDGYCNWIQSTANNEFKVYQNKYIYECYFDPPGIPGPCTNHGHFFLFLISQNFFREQPQIKDDQQTSLQLKIASWISQD